MDPEVLPAWSCPKARLEVVVEGMVKRHCFGQAGMILCENLVMVGEEVDHWVGLEEEEVVDLKIR